jgi:hypothetical protein
MVITPTIAVFDLDVSDPDTDAAALKVWEDALTISSIYGWSVTPLSNSRFRYTLVYA